MIDSPDNPKVHYLRRLARDRRFRRLEGRFVAEGMRLMEAAVEAGAEPEFVLVGPQLSESARGSLLLARLDAGGSIVFRASERAFAAASDTETPQGVVGVFPEQTGPAWPPDPSLVVALDRVRDPGNVGSIMRTSAAAGADGVLVLPECADPFGAKVVRAAMGAHFRIPLMSVRRNGFPDALATTDVVLADAAADLPYTSWDWLKPSVLVIGGEAEGASDAARARATAAVRIPMASATESLNAAAAAAVLLFHAATVRAASR